MVIDTSALVAIMQEESDAEGFLRRIAAAGMRRVSAAALLETAIVLEARSGEKAGDDLDLFLARAKIEIEPVTEEQVQVARKAWRRYGKGSGHAARLNFGDCFSYALAKSLGEELLFKGADFAHTDIVHARD
ncbi:MAG: type II toxin-antitoxin system VapC family toxin [Candidatus Sulfotelmatobacter sp.]|jgi:ribonuclease VapC